MNEIAIKQHSFEIAKNRLKEFSEKTETKLTLDTVDTDGFFPFSDHRVTGQELNTRLANIQDHFATINETNNKIIREFREVYNALDVLDKDYITSIIANVKAIEKTSNDVRIQQNILKQHNEKPENQQNKLDIHQVEINKSVEGISKIVNALKIFKDKLEEYRHLNDIDQIWKDIKNFSSILNESKKREEQFFINLKAIKEINDNIIIQHNELVKEHNELTKRLSEIDKNMENVSNTLDERKKRDEILLSIIQKNKVEVNKHIIDITQRTNDTLLSLTKKVKYTYWLAGSAIGLAIFELILLLKR